MMSTIWPITNQLRGKSDATQWAMEYFKKEYYILTEEMIPEGIIPGKWNQFPNILLRNVTVFSVREPMIRINKP